MNSAGSVSGEVGGAFCASPLPCIFRGVCGLNLLFTAFNLNGSKLSAVGFVG